MKGKKVILGIAMFFVIFTGGAWAGIAVPVSPGGGTGLTAQHCPAFSWSASDGAESYRVEVYEQVTSEIADRDAMSGMLNPVVAKEIPAPALSWTPSSGECLGRGMRYVWYVEGVDAEGMGQWSGGQVFQVEAAALSADQKEAVQEVVKGYLSGEGQAGETAGRTSTQDAKAGVVTPLYSESSSNNFFGTGAGANITSGYSNTFIGGSAGNHDATGHDNSFLGYYAGYSNTTGSYNSFLGTFAGNSNASGNENGFLGYSAGYHNTTGSSNSFVGAFSGYSNTEGNYNSFLGYYAGYYNTTGSANSSLGYYAGYHNTTGHDNSFLGLSAGQYSTTGSYNSYLGAAAGFSNSAGDRNSFIGFSAGLYNVTGSGNVFLGYEAGYNETGSNKLYIDNCFTSAGCTQPLIYGEFDNRIVRIDGRLEMVTVATPSDVRYKDEIEPLESSLEKVLKLRGVSYVWDKEKVHGAGFTDERQIGLIAQEVEKVLPELVHTDSKGYKTLSYDKLAPVLIEAVKEQQKEIEEKDGRIEKLERAIENMERRLALIENPAKTLARR